MLTLFLHIITYAVGIALLYYLSFQATKIEKKVYSILAYTGIIIVGVIMFYLISIYDNYYLEETYIKKPVNNIEILNVDNK